MTFVLGLSFSILRDLPCRNVRNQPEGEGEGGDTTGLILRQFDRDTPGRICATIIHFSDSSSLQTLKSVIDERVEQDESPRDNFRAGFALPSRRLTASFLPRAFP